MGGSALRPGFLLYAEIFSFPPIAGLKNVIFYDNQHFHRPFGRVKMQPLKVIFWNWDPTTIWHNIECVAFFS